MSRRRPSFIGMFNKHVKIGQWVTGRELAKRICKDGDTSLFGILWSGTELSVIAKECSMRLSNLERYGHVRRRYSAALCAFEYARMETPAVHKTSWFPSLPNHETIE